MSEGQHIPGSIAAWLNGLALGQYSSAFEDADIDPDVMPHLSDSDLIELGVTSLGHRRKIMAAASAPAPSAQPAPETGGGERLYLTVVFCDLVGSTRLAYDHGAERFSELLNDFYSAVEQVVTPYGGHIAQHHGDGVLVYFGYPDPLEDAARRGVESACAIIPAINRLHTANGEALAVRIGVASGSVVVNDQHAEQAQYGGRAYGVVVNLAARLQAEAETNSVILAGTTADLIGDSFELTGLGLRLLKGIEAPCRLFKVDGLKEPRHTPNQIWASDTDEFVNHCDELDQLAQQWEIAQQSGFALATVAGEHGIGKSRLIAEFLHRSHLDSGAARRVSCLPQGNHIPFYTFRQLLRQDQDAGNNRASGILNALDEITISAQAERRQRRAQIIADLFDYLAGDQSRPRILWFDDLHWADPSTLEVLQTLAQAAPSGLLLICGTRDPQQGRGFPQSSNAALMVLPPLKDWHTHTVVKNLLADVPNSEAFVETLVQRAEGIPIFAKELARELRAQLNEADEQDRPFEPDQALPSSLQQSLQARIRRLDAARPLMRLAAVFGRESPLPLLRELWTGPGRIETALNELVAADLAELQPGAGPNQENCLIIRHQMMLDCAYDIILSRDRIALHNRIADALIQRAEAGLEVEPSILANQLERAQRPQEAAIQWVNAGRAAMLQSADAEAVILYRRALSLIPEIPDTEKNWAAQFEADTLLALYPAVIGAEGYRSADASVMNRIRGLVNQTGGEQRVFSSMFFRWIDILAHGDTAAGHDFAMDLADIANKEPTGLHQMLLHRMLGTTFMFRGEFDKALEHLNNFVDKYDAEKHAELMRPFGATDNFTTVKSCFAAIHAITGTDEQSDRAIQEALDAAEENGLAHTKCHTLVFGAALPCALRGNWAGLRQHREQLHRIATDWDLAFWKIFDQMLLGIAMISEGAGKAGFDKVEDSLSTLKNNDFQFMSATFRTARALAEAATPSGPTEDLDALMRTLTLGEQWMQPYCRELKTRVYN